MVRLLLLTIGVALAFVGHAAADDRLQLLGKHVVGYQGWYGCPNDGGGNRWSHWFTNRKGSGESDVVVDLWPDLRELSPSERCATNLKLPNGQPAEVFSSANPLTVRRHFNWMKLHEIDGVAMQRFVTELQDPVRAVRPTVVLRNVRKAAEEEQRVFFVMYDLTGASPDVFVNVIQEDWSRLEREDRLVDSPSYVRHLGKPVVGLWGVGFRHIQLSPHSIQKLISFFRTKEVTLLAGVPAYWRTLQADSSSSPEWREIYGQFDVLSPWTVGRFANSRDAGAFARTVMAEDILATRKSGQGYLPVIFPGFSWHNLKLGAAPLDQIPRQCGAFYSAQVAGAISAGAQMIYTAMFDELDEGTAIFKIVRRSTELPAGITMLAPDQSKGCDLSTDLYLRLAGDATRHLRHSVVKH